MSVYARPHPGPLPGEREHTVTLPDHFSILMAVIDSVSLAVRRIATRHIAWLKTRRTILPLLGERAGVRADVILARTIILLSVVLLARGNCAQPVESFQTRA